MPDVYKLQRFKGGWAICLYRGGERISRRKIEADSRSAAQAEFDAIVAELTRPASKTVTDLWALYRADRAGRPIAVTMEFTGRAILPHFGAKIPDGITIADCRSYTAARRKAGRSDGSIWTELGHLRSCLLWAVDYRHITAAPAIERPAKPDPRDYYLTKEDLQAALGATAMPHIRLFLILAIATAARKQALFDLTWDRVDFETGQVDLRVEKTRPMKGRAVVPMNRMLRAALLEAKEGSTTDHVIEWAGRPVSSVRSGLDRVAEVMGVEKLTPHMLRHTAAVWMCHARVPMAEIARYLGHASTAITEKVYAKHHPDYLRDAAAALDIPLAGFRIVA